MSDRLYDYVGPADIRTRALEHVWRTAISAAADLHRWLREAEPVARRRSYVPATFIVDDTHQLWIADRHSEHVACAAGGAVLTAGEMVLTDRGREVDVLEISNQSTGYCPEPSSWAAIDKVLISLQIAHPPYWTNAFEFRRCSTCGSINLIKDDCYECSVCLAALSATWNF